MRHVTPHTTYVMSPSLWHTLTLMIAFALMELNSKTVQDPFVSRFAYLPSSDVCAVERQRQSRASFELAGITDKTHLFSVNRCQSIVCNLNGTAISCISNLPWKYLLTPSCLFEVGSSYCQKNSFKNWVFLGCNYRHQITRRPLCKRSRMGLLSLHSM